MCLCNPASQGAMFSCPTVMPLTPRPSNRLPRNLSVQLKIREISMWRVTTQPYCWKRLNLAADGLQRKVWYLTPPEEKKDGNSGPILSGSRSFKRISGANC